MQRIITQGFGEESGGLIVTLGYGEYLAGGAALDILAHLFANDTDKIHRTIITEPADFMVILREMKYNLTLEKN